MNRSSYFVEGNNGNNICAFCHCSMCNCDDYIRFVDVENGYATFSLVINFVNQNWMHCHIIVGLFETLKMFNAIIVKQVNVQFKLKNKVAPYVKDEKPI